MKLPFLPLPRLKKSSQRYLTGFVRELGQRRMQYSAADLDSALRALSRGFPEYYTRWRHGGRSQVSHDLACRHQIPRFASVLVAVLNGSLESE